MVLRTFCNIKYYARFDIVLYYVNEINSTNETDFPIILTPIKCCKTFCLALFRASALVVQFEWKVLSYPQWRQSGSHYRSSDSPGSCNRCHETRWQSPRCPLRGIIFQCDGSTQVAKCCWREEQVVQSKRRRGRGYERPLASECISVVLKQGASLLSGWIVSPFTSLGITSWKRDVELNPHQHIDMA